MRLTIKPIDFMKGVKKKKKEIIIDSHENANTKRRNVWVYILIVNYHLNIRDLKKIKSESSCTGQRNTKHELI